MALTDSTSGPHTAQQLVVPRLLSVNPSIGLWLGPLVPAADNRGALLLVTTAQLCAGLLLMTRRAPFGAWRRTKNVGLFLGGSFFVFSSGLEYARLMLPHDPWAVEAQLWRRWAVKHGLTPLFWLGAINYYQPLTLAQWKEEQLEVHKYLVGMEKDEEPEPVIIADGIKLEDCEELYRSVRRHNTAALDEQLLKMESVTEANRKLRPAPKVDYHKAAITLGEVPLEKDDFVDMVWATFEPWEELGQEVRMDFRLLPRSL